LVAELFDHEFEVIKVRERREERGGMGGEGWESGEEEVGRAWCELRLVRRTGQEWCVKFVRLGLEEGRV
jgi:hypothetical protein